MSGPATCPNTPNKEMSNDEDGERFIMLLQHLRKRQGIQPVFGV
jgi:hypothetical protein